MRALDSAPSHICWCLSCGPSFHHGRGCLGPYQRPDSTAAEAVSHPARAVSLAPTPCKALGHLDSGTLPGAQLTSGRVQQAQGQSSRDKITEKRRLRTLRIRKGGGGRPRGGGMDQPNPEITDDSHVNSVGGRHAEQQERLPQRRAQSPHQGHGLRSQGGPFPGSRTKPRSQDTHSEVRGAGAAFRKSISLGISLGRVNCAPLSHGLGSPKPSGWRPWSGQDCTLGGHFAFSLLPFTAPSCPHNLSDPCSFPPSLGLHGLCLSPAQTPQPCKLPAPSRATV